MFFRRTCGIVQDELEKFTSTQSKGVRLLMFGWQMVPAISKFPSCLLRSHERLDILQGQHTAWIFGVMAQGKAQKPIQVNSHETYYYQTIVVSSHVTLLLA